MPAVAKLTGGKVSQLIKMKFISILKQLKMNITIYMLSESLSREMSTGFLIAQFRMLLKHLDVETPACLVWHGCCAWDT